ncbi:MAG: hypothetical protein L6Q54_15575 [Leptospiraceae bacterium]|nr:hypothetical protein [Leptospiraceae bacterium]
MRILSPNGQAVAAVACVSALSAKSLFQSFKFALLFGNLQCKQLSANACYTYFTFL